MAVLLYWITRPLLPPKVSGYTRVTNTGRAKSFRVDALPVITTDGSWLYFAQAANSGMRSTLNRASASGGDTENHYETDPNWSPDQKALVFGDAPWLDGSAPGSAVIHILDLKTRKVSTLSGSEGLFSPHWSPDGRYVWRCR